MYTSYTTLFLLVSLIIPFSEAISCYECIGGRNDPLCNRYTGASCGYGLFGCVKIATYSGGVDKMGNFIDDDRSVISMIRGCNILPLGGVDACQQAVFPGIRIVTCYCYNDYCNTAVQIPILLALFLPIFLLLFSIN